MTMSEGEFVDKKEMIASLIFDYDNPELSDENDGYSEEACHDLAESILNALGFYPVG